MEHTISGVGVLDKAMAVVGAAETGPHSLAELVAATGFSRATTHRLASALEDHGLLRRDQAGRYVVGARGIALGRAAERAWPLAAAAAGALEELRGATGESVQLFVREGENRVCVASLGIAPRSAHNRRHRGGPAVAPRIGRESAG